MVNIIAEEDIRDIVGVAPLVWRNKLSGRRASSPLATTRGKYIRQKRVYMVWA